MDTVIDLTKYKMEEHVEKAFRISSYLAGNKPITPYIAINAAIIVSRTIESPDSLTAFPKLTSLLSIPFLGIDDSQIVQISNKSLKKLFFDSSLTKAYIVAEPFFRESQVVWGRDYVTFALLALAPIPQEIIKGSKITLDNLRDEWFQFVTSPEYEHRNFESWTKWWHSAGVPIPQERNQPCNDRYYLITWDPKRHDADDIDGNRLLAQRVEQEGLAVLPWTVGGKGASLGDRVFFMRQGDVRPGLIGSGQIISTPFEGRHWDENSPPNWTAFYANVLVDVFNEYPFIPLEDLEDQTGEKDLWTRNGTGFPIEDKVAKQLISRWCVAKTHPPQIRMRAWIATDIINGSQPDDLDMKQQASIFATLLIAKDVRPPFAIGLLGDWGVGKTSFMRLIKEIISPIVGKGAYSNSRPDSVSRVAQIEFNAWHYADSDLWASLASHIFDGLAEELSEQTKNEPKEIRQILRSKIDSSNRERENAQIAIEIAEKARESSVRALAVKQAEHDSKKVQYETKRLKRIWNAILKAELDEKSKTSMETIKEKAEETAKRLGITDGINDIKEAQRVYVSMRDLYQRGYGLTVALANEFTGGRIWISLLVIILFLLFVIFLLPFISSFSESFLGYQKDTIRTWLAPLLQLGTFIIAIAQWVGKKLGSISSAMNDLEKILNKFQESSVEINKSDSEEKKLLKDLEILDTEIEVQRCQIKEADRQIADAQTEIQRIEAGGLVYDFLQGCVHDSRYLDRLGLISIIRQDFEKLGSLLKNWQDIMKEEDRESALSDSRPIERIILYIDDLDRCPPQRVVEVLQAIHLLLAFDLFIVVVAVDARWLERSLNDIYNPSQLTKDEIHQKELHQFNAHNYLEKIIQIPYSLPRMQEQGYRKLISDMIAAPEEELKQQNLAEKYNEQKDSIILNQDSIQSDNKLKPNIDNEHQELKKRDDFGLLEQQQVQERINAMMLSSGEKLFIGALYPFILTPRLAKRFVNIYRLIRVRASMPDMNFATFVDNDNGDYRTVLLLLAITIGFPSMAPVILQDIQNSKEKDFLSWINKELTRYKNNQDQVESYDTLVKVQKKIKEVINGLKISNAPELNNNLETYVKWAQEVGRYSFHWHFSEDE